METKLNSLQELEDTQAPTKKFTHHRFQMNTKVKDMTTKIWRSKVSSRNQVPIASRHKNLVNFQTKQAWDANHQFITTITSLLLEPQCQSKQFLHISILYHHHLWPHPQAATISMSTMPTPIVSLEPLQGSAPPQITSSNPTALLGTLIQWPPKWQELHWCKTQCLTTANNSLIHTSKPLEVLQRQPIQHTCTLCLIQGIHITIMGTTQTHTIDHWNSTTQIFSAFHCEANLWGAKLLKQTCYMYIWVNLDDDAVHNRQPLKTCFTPFKCADL